VAGALAGLQTAAFGGGFLEVNGTLRPIDVPGANFTAASGINNAGQIVGWFNDSKDGLHGFLDEGGRPFLWRPGSGMADLALLVDLSGTDFKSLS